MVKTIIQISEERFAEYDDGLIYLKSPLTNYFIYLTEEELINLVIKVPEEFKKEIYSALSSSLDWSRISNKARIGRIDPMPGCIGSIIDQDI